MIEQDEMLHKASPLAGGRFYNDRFTLSVMDRDAGVFGVNHIQVSNNKGLARFRSIYSVGGSRLSYANRCAAPEDINFEKLTDGCMSLQVVQPLKEVRLTFDGPQYAFDLTYTGRFAAFDFADSLEGNPLGGPQTTGGFYEQAAEVKGQFELRDGPRKGERLNINCWATRSHTWDVRFADKEVWDVAPGEFQWFQIAMPERQMSLWVATGEAAQRGRLHEGGYNGTARGRRIWRKTSLNADMDGKTMRGFSCALTQINRDVFRLKSTKRHDAQGKLPMLGESDEGNFLDCYYDFFDVEIQDTGEKGYAVVEHSYFP